MYSNIAQQTKLILFNAFSTAIVFDTLTNNEPLGAAESLNDKLQVFLYWNYNMSVSILSYFFLNRYLKLAISFLDNLYDSQFELSQEWHKKNGMLLAQF